MLRDHGKVIGNILDAADIFFCIIDTHQHLVLTICKSFDIFQNNIVASASVGLFPHFVMKRPVSVQRYLKRAFVFVKEFQHRVIQKITVRRKVDMHVDLFPLAYFTNRDYQRPRYLMKPYQRLASEKGQIKTLQTGIITYNIFY